MTAIKRGIKTERMAEEHHFLWISLYPPKHRISTEEMLFRGQVRQIIQSTAVINSFNSSLKEVSFTYVREETLEGYFCTGSLPRK